MQSKDPHFQDSGQSVCIPLCLLLNRHVLIPLDLLLNRHHFYFSLRDDLLVVFYALFDCIEVLRDDFSWYCLHDFALLVADYLAFDWHFLNVGAILVLDYLLLVGHVTHSTLAYDRRDDTFDDVLVLDLGGN